MSELNASFMPELRRPVLVAAFRGWNDGGQGATLGAGYLAKQWQAKQFAEIEPETFYDFQATRPQVSLEDGMTRKLEWPENSFFHCEIPGAGRDAVILLRTEPARGALARPALRGAAADRRRRHRARAGGQRIQRTGERGGLLRRGHGLVRRGA